MRLFDVLGPVMKMQTELWEKHKDKWPPMQPEYGKDFILWMIEEVGEVISIIKKKSIHDIMDDPAVHSHFVEELGDVLMYYMDTLLRYQITPEEISKTYQEKHNQYGKKLRGRVQKTPLTLFFFIHFFRQPQYLAHNID